MIYVFMHSAGSLNEIIIVQRLREIQTEYGDIKHEYADHLRIRAAVKRYLGKRKDIALEDQTLEEIWFTVRYYHDIVDSDIILWNGYKFKITWIDRHRNFQEINIHTEKINE